ncbi:MAG: hypothetical protein AVDCRST_MAG96-2080 [uncultured Segetibacter sp.]|uniref:Uncharacterized protein n=1 Tax=uncultured Segetibacter sp. TaxID=481133 RepID=A0A6J4SR78_9BACT|nr:MAG: hypothetical protein AVDCRST_MAG96-2080 [uncultured Segetibacter sp.]
MLNFNINTEMKASQFANPGEDRIRIKGLRMFTRNESNSICRTLILIIKHCLLNIKRKVCKFHEV